MYQSKVNCLKRSSMMAFQSFSNLKILQLSCFIQLKMAMRRYQYEPSKIDCKALGNIDFKFFLSALGIGSSGGTL